MENEFVNNSTDSSVDRSTQMDTFDLFNPEEGCLEKYKQKFEQEWSVQRDFSLEDCLGLVKQECPDMDIDDMTKLFRDILTIDINKGYAGHCPVTRQDYITRFPQWKDVICDVDDQVNLTTMAKTTSLEGQFIEKYSIERMIGRGGMGLVFRALDTKLDRTIALKLLLPRWKQQPQSLELFKQEMHIMAQMPLGSPFVVIYDEGIYKGDPYIVMEYIDGVTLISYLKLQKNNRLDYKTVLDFTIQIAKGLQTIHSQNILHRDIKPDNIMVQEVTEPSTLSSHNSSWNSANELSKTVPIDECNDNCDTIEFNSVSKPSSGTISSHRLVTCDAHLYPNGRIRILDLGLGRFHTSNMQEVLTTTQKSQNKSKEQIIGAVAYMAPECVSNPQYVDARCDIYSLGRTILYLLTGSHPTAWYNPFDYSTDKPISLSKYLVNNSVKVPPKFVSLLEQMMETNVSKRIESATVLLERLNELPKPKKESVHHFSLASIIGFLHWGRSNKLQEPKKESVRHFSLTSIIGFVLLGIMLIAGACWFMHNSLVNDNRNLLNTIRTLQKEGQYEVNDWDNFVKINKNYLLESEKTELLFLRTQFATMQIQKSNNPYFIPVALEASDEYLKIDPESLECLSLRAEAEFYAGTLDDEQLKDMEEGPLKEEISKNKKGFLQKAFNDIVTVLKEEPKNVPAQLLAGKIHYALYQCDNEDKSYLTTAIEIFQDILDTYNPRSSETMIWLAKAQIENKNYQFAFLLLSRVLELDKHNLEARRLHAEVCYNNFKNYIFAAEDILFILNSPNLAKKADKYDHQLLIMSLYNMGDYKECAHYCTLLLADKKSPVSNIFLYDWRGKAYSELGKTNKEAGKIKESEDYFKKADADLKETEKLKENLTQRNERR